jgi:RNA-directed DNA polymerase
MRKVAKERRLSDLETPLSVRKLQTALHAKAKAEPEFRFYLLYDKVHREDVLWFAYARCKANGGAAGVDGQSFTDIEAYGVTKWLGELAKDLRGRTYELCRNLGDAVDQAAWLAGISMTSTPFWNLTPWTILGN